AAIAGLDELKKVFRHYDIASPLDKWAGYTTKDVTGKMPAAGFLRTVWQDFITAAKDSDYEAISAKMTEASSAEAA
ncbi:MAG: hypothetical protein Q8P27_01590, partial [Candidatus Peregrinibacteria bacterium]|nr:hypothetical protein [Candidatus Peregrinibacteria bacterium]